MADPLENARSLEKPPGGPLGSYLATLARLLEDAFALRFGFFRGAACPPAAAAALSEDIRRVAQAGFEHALRARPDQVDQLARNAQ
jgi:hypothetical protein